MATGTEIERLFVKIEGDISGLRSSLAKATSEVDKAEKGMGGKLEALAKRFPAVTKFALGTAAAVAAVAVAAIRGGQVAVKYADDLGDTATALGLNVEKLQELRFAAVQSGVAQEEMDRALMRLNVAIGDGVRNGGAAAEKFERLGVSLTDTEGRTRDTDAVFTDLVDRLSQIPSVAERTAAAGDILGDKLGPKLQGLLGRGRDGLDQLREAARKTGAVMDEATIKKAGEAQDKLDALAMVTKAQLTIALVELGPILVGLAGLIVDVASAVNATVTAFKALAGTDPFGETNEAIEKSRAKIARLRKETTLGYGPVANREKLKVLEEEEKRIERLTAKYWEEQEAAAAAANPMRTGAAGSSGSDEEATRAAAESWDERVEAQRIAEEEIAEFNEARDKRLAEERAEREMDDAEYMASWQERVLAQQEAEEEIGEFKDQELEEERARSEAYIEEWWARVDEQKEAEEEVSRFNEEMHRARYAAARNALTNLSTLMASSSRKMFEVGKAAAIAQTIIDTYAAAQSAYKALAGIPVVGPGLGAAAAAAAVVGGLARVQAIKSTSFGSRSVAVGVGGGVAVGSSERGGGGPGGGGGGPVTYISLPSGQWFSSEFMRDFIMRLNEAQGDGARIRVVS